MPKQLSNFMIVKSSLWKGKPVHYILLYYMKLFLQICRFFKERKLLFELKKEKKIENQIKYYNDRINWIGDSGNIIIKKLRYLMNTKEKDIYNEKR